MAMVLRVLSAKMRMSLYGNVYCIKYGMSQFGIHWAQCKTNVIIKQSYV